MADLWQAYSGWVLYAVFFAAFIWLHARMHGRGGHGCGHAGHSHADRRGAGQGEHQHGTGDQVRRDGQAAEAKMTAAVRRITVAVLDTGITKMSRRRGSRRRIDDDVSGVREASR